MSTPKSIIKKKVEKLIQDMYHYESTDRCKIFKFKLDYYAARIEHFELLELITASEIELTGSVDQ